MISRLFIKLHNINLQINVELQITLKIIKYFFIPLLIGGSLFLITHKINMPLENYLMLTLYFLVHIAIICAHTHISIFDTIFRNSAFEVGRKRGAIIFVTFFFIFLLLSQNLQERQFWLVLIYSAVIHYTLQPMEWVYFFKKKSQHSKFGLYLCMLFVFFTAFIPVLIWHSSYYSFGWWSKIRFTKLFDLEQIKFVVHFYLFGSLFFLLLIGFMTFKSRIQFKVALFVFLNWLGWFLALMVFESLLAFIFLVELTHAFSYILLKYRLNKGGRSLTTKLNFLNYIIPAVILAYLHISLSNSYFSKNADYRYLLNFSAELANGTKAFLMGFIGAIPLSHYVFDCFMWRKVSDTDLLEG